MLGAGKTSDWMDAGYRRPALAGCVQFCRTQRPTTMENNTGWIQHAACRELAASGRDLVVGRADQEGVCGLQLCETFGNAACADEGDGLRRAFTTAVDNLLHGESALLRPQSTQGAPEFAAADDA